MLIDKRHNKPQNQIPLIKPRKENLPILIAMPPVVQQRRRAILTQPTTLLQSKSGNLQGPYYQGVISGYNTKRSPPPPQQYPQHQIPPANSNGKYQYT
jgi:hypothetical protein